MAGRVIRLGLAYDGTAFRGWARQRDRGVRTIEGVLVERLETILREAVKLSVAGRTDAGVHARGQVTSFHTGSGIPPERLQRALNDALAPEVVVLHAGEVPEGFDARFSATAREYAYRIDVGARTEGRDLSSGVDPGVGSAGDRQLDRLAQDRLETRCQDPLDGPNPRIALSGPASERGPIVRQAEPDHPPGHANRP